MNSEVLNKLNPGHNGILSWAEQHGRRVVERMKAKGLIKQQGAVYTGHTSRITKEPKRRARRTVGHPGATAGHPNGEGLIQACDLCGIEHTLRDIELVGKQMLCGKCRK